MCVYLQFSSRNLVDFLDGNTFKKKKRGYRAYIKA